MASFRIVLFAEGDEWQQLDSGPACYVLDVEGVTMQQFAESGVDPHQLLAQATEIGHLKVPVYRLELDPNRPLHDPEDDDR